MTEQDLQEALKTLKDYAVSINSAVSTLVDALNILTTSTQTLPEEQGYYLTQQRQCWSEAITANGPHLMTMEITASISGTLMFSAHSPKTRKPSIKRSAPMRSRWFRSVK